MATVTATTGLDNFTGLGGAGNTTAGDDTINAADNTANAGDVWNGGSGTDTLNLSTPASKMDLTAVIISGFENLVSGNGADTITMSADQFFGFSSINTGNGGDTVSVKVSGTFDGSALVSPTLTSVDALVLNGSSGDEHATFTGTQINSFGNIDLSSGTDTLSITSTSTGLNGLADVQLINAEAISAAGAASGVTITLSNQTEGFAITGSAHNDILTGGTGNDAITGGAGNDTINGGGGTGDSVVFSGNWADYTITDNGGGSYTITDNAGSDGTDIVSNVENFTFVNGTFTAAQIVNDTPTDIALSANTVDETASNATVVGSLTSTDADSALGDTATYTLIDDAGGRFAISGGNIVVADGSLLDYETTMSHDVTVRVTDAHGAFFDKILAINLNDLNDETPTITSGGVADFAENDTGTVYAATATDSDTVGSITWSLTGDDAALFAIDASGNVTFLAPPDFETPADTGGDNVYDIVVHANDGVNDGTKAVAITVTDVNDVTPTITSGGVASFAENDTGTVYAATATDPDTVGSITWSLTGDDAALFTIDSSGNVTFNAPPDFETPADTGGDNVYDIVVHANDGVNDGTKAVAITVTNVGATITGTAGDDTITTLVSPPGQPPATIEEDVIFGLGGNDTIDAGAGDDWVWGDAGADNMVGGAGIDTLFYGANGGPITINLGNKTVSGGNANGDTFSGFENVIGTGGADVMIGNSQNNLLSGAGGNDNLQGGLGNDTLDGGTGNDTLVGGAGADVLLGGDGTDTANYSSSSAALTVDLAAGTGSGGDAAGDTLDSVENVIGTSQDDVLTGSAANNALTGNDGNDTIDGGDGDDWVFGGAGTDNMVGGAGVDTLYYGSNGGSIAINLGNSTVSGGNATGDTFNGFENVIGTGGADVIVGNSQDNFLSGAGGNDTIQGGLGNDILDGGGSRDILNGGAGTDMLIGGGGVDIFVFAALTDSTVGAGHDAIADFSQASLDVIDLHAIDAVDGGTDDAFHFTAAGGTGLFTGVAGELRYFVSGPDTLVQGDTDGDGTADFEIGLNGLYALTAADFIL